MKWMFKKVHLPFCRQSDVSALLQCLRTGCWEGKASSYLYPADKHEMGFSCSFAKARKAHSSARLLVVSTSLSASRRLHCNWVNYFDIICLGFIELIHAPILFLRELIFFPPVPLSEVKDICLYLSLPKPERKIFFVSKFYPFIFYFLREIGQIFFLQLCAVS